MKLKSNFLTILLLALVSSRPIQADDQPISQLAKEVPVQELAYKVTITAKNPEAVAKLVDIPQPLLSIYEFKASNGESTYRVKIRGRIIREDGSMLVGYGVPKMTKPPQFEIWLPVTREQSKMVITHVDDYGEVTSEDCIVTIEKWAEIQTGGAIEVTDPNLPKKFSYAGSLGVSSISYQQSSFNGSPKALALTLKISTDYRLYDWRTFRDWSAGIVAFYNIINFSNTNGKLSFLGINLRAGRPMPWLDAPWTFYIYGGWYYLTLFTNSTKFGFQNVSGPQLFPVLKRNFENSGSQSTYVKFSPVRSGFGFLSLDSFELATGTGYSHPSPWAFANRWVVAVDFSYLSLTLPKALNLPNLPNTTGSASTFTLSSGMLF